MSPPELIELRDVDFITIDTIGPPGQRTFYLQAAQANRIVTLIIEKEHAAALSIAISGLLGRFGDMEEEPDLAGMDLIHPVEPLFRVGQLGLGYDQVRDMLVIMAEEVETEGRRRRIKAHIWADRAQMSALARKSAAVVASGRPICPLCNEPIDPGTKHVCTRGNGRKRIYEV